MTPAKFAEITGLGFFLQYTQVNSVWRWEAEFLPRPSAYIAGPGMGFTPEEALSNLLQAYADGIAAEVYVNEESIAKRRQQLTKLRKAIQDESSNEPTDINVGS